MSSPHLSDEEINELMNFNSLLDKRNTIIRTRYRLLKWSLGITAVVLVTMTTLYLAPLSDDQNVNALREDLPTSNSELPKTDTINMKENLETETDTYSKLPEVTNNTQAKQNTKNNNLPPKEEALPKATENEERIKKEDDVYSQAEPVHGYESLYKYFDQNLVYPKEALKDSIQGIVTVSFIVTINGNAEAIEFRETLGKPFEDEATRLVQQMPVWKPATLNGKAVPSKIVLPISFSIKTVTR